MYLAELHGKLSSENENREDILTSNVFSFFKYADRMIFLYPFLRMLGLEITHQDADQAEFYFWPHFEDYTEPDLVIIAGSYYLLLEAKYFSGFGQERGSRKHQLAREIEGGLFEANNLEKKFRLVALTAHYHCSPEIFKDIPAEIIPVCTWVNWQQITFLVANILQSGVDLRPETRLFAEDLYHLLVRKNLRSYQGIAALQHLPRLVSTSDRLFFDSRTAAYRGSLIGFLSALGTFPRLHSCSGHPLFYRSSIGWNFFRYLIKENPRLQKIEHPLFFSRRTL